MTLIRIGWDYLKRKKVAFFAIVLLQVAQILLSLVLPAINAKIIDDGIAAGNTSLIWSLGAVMLGIAIVQLLTLVGAIYLGARIAMDLGRELRGRAFRQVQSFSATDQHKFGAPTLITRVTNDVTQAQMVILLTFTVMIMAPIMGFGGVFMAIQQNAHLSLLLVIIVPVLAALIFFVMRALAPRYTTQQERTDRINTLLREQLTGVRVIRAFVRQQTVRTKFDQASLDLRRIGLEIGVLWAFLMPAASFIVGASSAAVVWFAAHLISAGTMQVGALTAFISYLMMIMVAVMLSGMMVIFFPRGEVSAKRLQRILDVTPSITAPAKPVALPKDQLTFELDAVGLRYPGAEEPVLSDITMRFAPGTESAVIGSTGSGKSSIIRLLPRLIDATSGEVRAGGIPVSQLDPQELRSRIALVPQKAFLFSGTIATNVAGSARPDADYDADRVTLALQAAQAWDFVSKLEDGIESKVEPGGKNFSGGQRQRLTIARAIYRCLPDANGHRQADLLVFDDSFSALDFSTDARLRNGLRSFIGDMAVVIVAQRVSTIRNADQIFVLDDGRIVGVGKHLDLLENCSTYQEIVASQLDAEETR
ncbi:ABC transporter ATP-binding protein [Trueperella pyogenes]|uniref:ABC transporter ATP-binding protein n=1 Tax=Trueperella pyogenes TaxID=1661 RepID=UPI000F853F68|nr:ABC transporter ATP-binding protein [Trueperella pyogenes]AZR03331.1 ABC transporter ATP-binding protein [Trueperella pyogenes]WHU59303.1 ABC transporter ATP-binding protein [Trueperella pyogenes]